MGHYRRLGIGVGTPDNRLGGFSRVLGCLGMPEDHTTKLSGSPETSESEEMYLLTIAVAAEDGHQGPLALAALAEALQVSPASVNEMVRKLEGRDLVSYEPYHGVSLTEAGLVVAHRVLRTRRLWARFLADHLGFTPHQADAMACDLEHVTPEEAAERLADYLGNPEAGPLGRPIPGASSVSGRPSPEPLTSVPAGVTAELAVVAATGPAAGFLAGSGLEPGAVVEVLAIGGGGVLLGTARGQVHLVESTAAAILVHPLGRIDGS